MNRQKATWIFIGLVLLLFIAFFIHILGMVPSPTVFVEEKIEVPIITADDVTLGTEDPSVIFVHFGYVGCEYCEELQTTLRNLQEENPEEILLIWKDFPNTGLAPHSLAAAEAARCAGEQDAFWEYQPYLMNGTVHSPEYYLEIATELELKEKKFSRCLENESGLRLVQSNISEGEALGITATPTLFINGERHTGLLTEFELRELLREL